jgi:hypothetical protein
VLAIPDYRPIMGAVFEKMTFKRIAHVFYGDLESAAPVSAAVVRNSSRLAGAAALGA